ncbi:MAG: hypothetical protein HYZ94_03030 [Candidatus Omnitrophica bacterium]|nr:hypothetical protein [Candidatus Omnitrophota bacterium]
MTREEWLKRQEQWDRFHAWEAKQGPLSLSPEECLAEIGALLDLALAGRRSQKESAQDLRAAAEGIVLMRRGLACLEKAA